MKTKKTSKILSVVLTLAVLVCSLSVVSGFVTTAETNSGETELINSLKNAWQAMYTPTKIANLKTDKLVQNFATTVDVSTAGLTFKSENKVDKTAVEYDDKNTGIIFQNSDQGGSAWFDKNNRFNNYTNVFDDSKYDALGVTFKTGNVTTAGKAYLLCTYTDYNSTESAKIDITVEDSNKTVMLDTKTLFGKKLSELLKKGSYDLKLFKVGFSKDLGFKGAELSELYALKYVTLPENSENFTALEWYNAAKDLDVSGYENTDAFNTALNNLKNYLSENDAGFMVSELKESWGELSKEVSVAEFNSDSKIVNQQNLVDNFTDASIAGIKFNDNGTFDKDTYTETFGGNYLCMGFVFNKGENKLFSSGLDSSDNNLFTNTFKDDSLYFTFNPGTVKTAGRMWVILQYNGDSYKNVLYSPVEIATKDSNTDQNIEINKLDFKCASSKDTKIYKFTKLSEALTYTNSDGDIKNLTTIKVFFNPSLVTTDASISGLKTIKSETVPADENLELISGKSLRVDAVSYGEIASNFVANRNKFYNYLMTDKTLGNVNETDDIDICDLVALVKLGYENDGTYKLVADMNKDGYITEADKTELRSNILKQ